MSDQETRDITEKSCPRCAAFFECRSSGCWCNDLQLSAAKLKWLERQYENCLCPACLTSIESCRDGLECDSDPYRHHARYPRCSLRRISQRKPALRNKEQ
jgi:hypothetical protein